MSGIIVKKLDIYRDDRGYNMPICLNDESYVEDRMFVSNKYALRGLHGDKTTGKLFIPMAGAFQIYAKNLSSDDSLVMIILPGHSVFIPAGYINGTLGLDNNNVMYYKWTEFYKGPENQITVRWDDPTLAIQWLTKSPIISERDRNGKSFNEVKCY